MIFRDTVNRTGAVDLLEDWTGTESSSNYTVAMKTRDLNLGLDAYQMLSTPASGTWQADDINHARYPNFTFDLISGQFEYNFDEDEQGNKILDVYRLERKSPANIWEVMKPYNEMGSDWSIAHQETQTGIPTKYYKAANGIFVDVAPNYNQREVEEGEGGFRMWYARTPSYYVATGEDTKEAGIPPAHHVYPVLWATVNYWLPIDTAKANLYAGQLAKLEKEIKKYYSNRSRDEEQVVEGTCVNPY